MLLKALKKSGNKPNRNAQVTWYTGTIKVFRPYITKTDSQVRFEKPRGAQSAWIGILGYRMALLSGRKKGNGYNRVSSSEY